MGTQREIQSSLVKPKHPILLFDGVCNICDYSVQFVIKHNKSESVHFAALQSSFGQEQLKKSDLPSSDLKSLIFIEDGDMYTRSTGALKLARHLNSPWKWAYIFIIIPRPIRDWFYNYIAAHRYQWFGEKDACMIPSKEVRERFIEI